MSITMYAVHMITNALTTGSVEDYVGPDADRLPVAYCTHCDQPADACLCSDWIADLQSRR